MVIPKLEKGFQDLEIFVAKHKQFYKEQMQRISSDIDTIINKFV